MQPASTDVGRIYPRLVGMRVQKGRLQCLTLAPLGGGGGKGPPCGFSQIVPEVLGISL